MRKILYPLYLAYCKTLEIAVSRKYLVLWTGVYLLSENLITGTEFLPIALAVLGLQGWVDNKTPPRKFDEASMPGGTVG